MPREPRLTETAHVLVSAVLGPGSIAIDATAGNGHDTVFLAARVGTAGRVYAFDVQAEALEHTRRRLEGCGLADRVTLIHHSHERLCVHVPEAVRGQVAAVMFNLGYLPRSDRQCVTGIATTVPALEQAVDCMRPGGILTVIAYRGHPGGSSETAAVRRWFRRHPALAAGFREAWSAGERAPVLLSARIAIPGTAP